MISGTIQVKADTVNLTDSLLSTSAYTAVDAGSITVEAQRMTLKNSQILSTRATVGDGGTITITSPILHRDAISVIDASSQSGTDGTVTINGVIRPRLEHGRLFDTTARARSLLRKSPPLEVMILTINGFIAAADLLGSRSLELNGRVLTRLSLGIWNNHHHKPLHQSLA